MYMHVFIYTNYICIYTVYIYTVYIYIYTVYIYIYIQYIYIYIQYIYIYTSNLHPIWGRQNIELDEVIEIFMDRFFRTRRISVLFEDEHGFAKWISYGLDKPSRQS